jgi:hypothetical protein
MPARDGRNMWMPAKFSIIAGRNAVVLDADTEAWVAAVVSNGGSVSAGRQSIVNDLIVDLKADGIWDKLDRLWLFAAEDAPGALTDLVGLSLATATNSPTFTADLGYTGASTKYIDSNFNPSTAGGNYAQNSASLAAWTETTTGIAGAIVGASVPSTYQIYSRYSDDTAYWRINITSDVAQASTDGSGWWLASRTGANQSDLYRNGASFDSDAGASVGPSNVNVYFLRNSTEYFTGSVSAGLIGGGLNSTEDGNLYTRVSTYMTAVGL